MNSPKKIPHLSYDLSYSHPNNLGRIVAGDVVFRRISNLDEFYRALGYPDGIMATGVLPEKFIWDRYTRDHATKSIQCLQAHIAAYLHNHSEMFREEYGSEYANMIGKCLSDKIDDSDLCVHCPMHPRSLYNSAKS